MRIPEFQLLFKVLRQAAKFNRAVEYRRIALLALRKLHPAWGEDLSAERFGEYLVIHQTHKSKGLVVEGDRLVKYPFRSLALKFSERWHYGTFGKLSGSRPSE